MTSSVSPKTAAALSALYGGAATTAAETPVPQTTPPGPRGMQMPVVPGTAMAPAHHDLSPQPARSLQPEMDAAKTTEIVEVQRAAQIGAANIDEKIADVEAKLNQTIEKLNADMDGKLAQIKDSFDRLMSAFAAQLATVNAPPKYTEAAAPAATATHLVSYAPAGTLPASSASTAAAAPVAEPVQARQPDLMPDHWA